MMIKLYVYKLKRIILFRYEDIIGPKKFFDIRTYHGNFRFFIYSCVSLYFLWHTYDIYAWWDHLWGQEKIIDASKQSWARLWAVIIGGSGIIASIFAMTMITLNRRRAQKSAKGQWYDMQSLKPEDLVSDIPEDCSENTEPVQDDISLPEFRTWKEDPQEPIGIAPPAEAQSPHQFGDARLEMKNGDAVLLVRRKKK